MWLRHPAVQRRAARGAPLARGFTLIEVLVALAIVAIALASALRAVGSVATGSAALHDRLLAGWSADNRVAELALQRAWPEIGVTTFSCPQGDRMLLCIQTVAATPNPVFRRVEVSVRSVETGDTLLADLVTVVADEARRAL
ncbi:MAG: type II secretion system minor pseudopilin GspI [Janthinobacterium lividum]